MKQRFSSLDVKIIAHELSTSLVSLRLANVYDLSSRIFLLKFAKPDRREQLVIDSGFRAHLTSFARTTAASPSPFIARLRKFLRTRRVTAVKQVGTDRILEITFSDGLYRLFLEFYAGGNIVLTDGECTILGLLRNVAEGAEHEQYKLGGKYDLELRQNFAGVPELTTERVREGLKKAVEKQREEADKPGKKKVKVKEGDRLRKALAVTTTEFPPVLIEHVLLEGGFDRETKPEEVVESEELLGRLVGCLERAGEVLKEITSAEVAKGYIVAKRKAGGAAQEQKEGEEKREEGLLYDDFHPFKPAQLAGEGVEFLEYEGFNKAVDEFFSSIEGQRLESKLQEREDAAKRKIEQARQEQENRIQGLQQTADLNVQKAQAIEANVERVEEAVAAVNGLIAQGMDWVDIGHLIKNEQSRQNPVAQTIKLPLKLHENTITLLLSGYDDVADEEMADETDSEASDSESEDTPASKSRAKPEDKRLTVDIDLAQSPWANARLYYDQRRTATVKQEKTAQASVKALKSTEQKVMADLKKGLKQEKDVLRPVRRQMWFEKFTYFVSSDGYLVLAGKDVQQTEILYRRYLKKGDVYVHADLPGAASVIIKNNPATPEAPIPPSTLSQAGNLSVCTSSAWDNKAIMSAWWVLGEHVTKIAPTGDFLPAGTFNIKTKKNYLPPAQLLLGFGVLFQISEDSKARHFKNRLGDATLSAAGDGQSAEQEAIEELSQEKDDDDDEDDEFPDAGREAVGNDQADDEDDDFPDAQDEQEHEDHEPAVRSNPLQSKGAAADDEDEDSDDDDSNDEQKESQPEANEQVETEEHFQADQPSKQGGKAGGKAEAKQQQQQPKKMTRGKRGKAKRQAAKYAEQDDEDRELAMQLLGSRAAEERREAEAAQKAAEKESAEEARARRRAQHEKAQQEGLAAEELRRLTLEEGGQDLDEEEAAQMALLDSFVGTPLPGDEILEVIPVCAPWTAMAKYKYKVKLQPGAQKKGKAIREILTVWNRAGSEKKNIDVSAQDKEMIWPREAELVRGLKEVEVVGIIPVKSLRVVISGGSAGGGGGDKGKGGAKSRGQKKGRGGKGSKKK